MQTFTKRTAALLLSLTAATAFAQHSDHEDAIKESDLAQRRAEILQMSSAAITELKHDSVANKLYGEAYGHAVFDTTKGGFIVTGAGGIGLGAGIENYKLIILFENKDTYQKFTEGAWSAGFSAQAAAGDSGKGVVGKFVNGIAVYHQSDKGLIAQVDVTGVKFWPSDRLNPGVG